MSKKTKGNKGVLESVHYSLEIIKNIKERKEFSQTDKENILKQYVGLSKDNNSFFTPIPICSFICNLLDIKENMKIADLSAGIGNMCIPLIKEYGQLKDDITFDMYELDENNSLAGSKAWEDYKQVKYYSNCDTLNYDIPENYYDCIIGNPPFVGSIPYMCEWNNNKGKIKKNQIVDAFIDKSFKVCKENGYIALVLPQGFCFKGNGTGKLRDYLKERYSLLFCMELDQDTFANAGITGTGVGTVLCVFQKCKQTKPTIYCKLDKTDKLDRQFKGIIEQLKICQNKHYINYSSSFTDGLYGTLHIGELEDVEEDYRDIKTGKCYCCNKDVPTWELTEYSTKDKSKKVQVCLECDNDELMYLDKIKRDLLSCDGESYEVTKNDEKQINKLKEIKEQELKEKERMEWDKNIYILTNCNGKSLEFMEVNNQLLNLCNEFHGIDKFEEQNWIKIKYPYLISKTWEIDNFDIFEKVKITLEGYTVQHEKCRKNKNEDWQDRIKCYWFGKIITNNELYDTTFGFFTEDSNKEFNGDIWINYDYICSKNYIFKKLIKQLLKEDGWIIK
ncbi:N-6 DNA methylase [Clostridium botulinum]|uniref:N-6 DNA methylase n=1 Tax=Clostridium botulinum TaxID=1491 RepID=UPI0004D64FFC|nr:N-6 DNA methylase [Clostridium botulinum]KEH99694.1 putative type I site-specific deoxyribonuclease, M subunit [Clostridium botulinum C/D str. BKT75002]KEI05172.1 putative type I site-specific deoxyribonuclease, M subunit [Clostridium botulinum C/D str. BKT2873]QPW62068.1 N-6 DNA methylase [Clostridium botulinum]